METDDELRLAAATLANTLKGLTGKIGRKADPDDMAAAMAEITPDAAPVVRRILDLIADDTQPRILSPAWHRVCAKAETLQALDSWPDERLIKLEIDKTVARWLLRKAYADASDCAVEIVSQITSSTRI